MEYNIGDEVQVRDLPAGLKNYGATCYVGVMTMNYEQLPHVLTPQANAFLQLWFNNVTFRNGVYDTVGKVGTPLYHLANIFAKLQCSQRSVVDPGELVEALRLNKGHQQDAAE